MYDEIKSLIEEQGSAIQALRRKYDGDLEAERKEREDFELRINKLLSLPAGGPFKGATRDEVEHKNAFLNEFIRKGITTNIEVLEKKP